MNETAIRTRRWTRREYERLIGMVRAARSGERITPLAAPSASVAVDDLLP